MQFFQPEAMQYDQPRNFDLLQKKLDDFLHFLQAECQSMCSYLIEAGSNDEAQWISDTFLDKGSYTACVGRGGGVQEKDKAAKLESIMLRMHNRFTQLYTSN